MVFDMSIEETFETEHPKGCFFTNCSVETPPNEAVKELTEENFHQVVEQYEKLVIQAQERGEISTDRDARAIAHFLYSSHNGMRVISKITDDPRVLEDIKAETLRVLT